MSAAVEKFDSLPISLSSRIEQAFEAYHGRIMKVLDPLNKEHACYDIAKRILLLVSAVIFYPVWGFKCLIDRCIDLRNPNRSKSHATLESEIRCATKDILSRVSLENCNLNDAKSAKLFLILKHGGVVFSKAYILRQDVNQEQILRHFDLLVKDSQTRITFDSINKTEVDIGILTTGKDDQEGLPTFSLSLTARATAHCGKASNPGVELFTKVLASDDVQDCFCYQMGINPTPQIDAQGNFI